MQKLIKKYPHENEYFWFDYFLNQTRNRACSLAPQHLQAYLEETCDSCARKVRTKFKATFKHFNDYLNEYFQDARLIVWNIDKFWRKYNPDLASPQRYAQIKLEHILTERMFVDKPTSPYGSLVRASRKYMEEALIGLSTSQRSQYLLVHAYLKEMKARLPRVNRKFQEPTLDQFVEIAKLCQTQHNLNLSCYQVKEILETCIKALEDKRPHPVLYIEDLLNNQVEDQKEEIVDNEGKYFVAADIPSYQPLENSRILTILLGKSIDSLESVVQNLPKDIASGITEKLLVLSYGFVGVKQKDIGQDLGMEQYEVSRSLKKIKRSLIQALVNIAKQYSQIKIDIKYLNTLGDEIEDLLTWYYRQHVLQKELENALRSHSSLRNGINTLMVYFSHLPKAWAERLQDISLPPKELDKYIAQAQEKLNFQKDEIAQKLQTSTQKMVEQIDGLMTESVQYLSNYFRKKLNLNVEIISKIQECLYRSVYVFLCNAPYGLLVKVG